MTTTAVHPATPADALAGRLNALIAAVLRVPDSAVVPHARLREDLGGHPLSLQRLVVAIEVSLDLDPVPFARAEDRCLSVGDLHQWYAEQAGRAA